jgi:proteasome lid subunit RPN8/RPN11
VRQLRRRGNGKRESGAFLLGRRDEDGGTISAFVFYDDIDPDALSKGYVHLAGSALNKVWDCCAETGLEVLADVHTHPGLADQSSSDREHPMVAIRGHTALIIPNLAQSALNLRAVGVYRHLGALKWVVLPAPKPGWRGLTLE